MLGGSLGPAALAIAAAAAGLAPSFVNAQLQGLRATIPGSLHQCENTNLFFFDSSNTRPLTVLFLDPDNIPDSARSGTVELSDAAGYSPLQVIQGIETPDAAQFGFELDLAQGQVFEVFAFLPDGQGKAMSLTRTVTTPLPGATSCLGNAQTTVSGVDAAATTSSSSSSSRRTTSASSSSRVSGVSAATTSAPTTRATSAASRSTSTTQATVTAPATAGTNPAAALSTPSPTGSASSNMVISGMLGLVASLAVLAVL